MKLRRPTRLQNEHERLQPQSARLGFEHWTKNGTWPIEEQANAMDRFQDIVNHALARKRSGYLSRKRSNASLNTVTAQTQTPSSQQPRDQKKSALYRRPLFEDQLECGSLIDDYGESITAQSEKLCQMQRSSLSQATPRGSNDIHHHLHRARLLVIWPFACDPLVYT